MPGPISTRSEDLQHSMLSRPGTYWGRGGGDDLGKGPAAVLALNHTCPI